MTTATLTHKSKLSRWRALRDPKMLLILIMGFSSGLPFFLTASTLQAWMSDSQVDLRTIGLFALVGFPYIWKFLWAPLTDRYNLIPRLGRRRSWMLLSQLGLIATIAALGFTRPEIHPWRTALFAVFVAFFSATQDIVLDAWRRESLTDNELGLGSSTFVTGYLVGMRLVSGALALYLADHMPWNTVYLIMASLVGLGLITTLIAKEPLIETSPPRTLRESVMEPFLDFFRKDRALLLLVFILLYKLGDNMASTMTMPLYLEMGFSKTDVAAVTKIFGWIATVAGGVFGGVLILRLRIMPALFWFGILQALSTLAFAALVMAGKNQLWLMGVIAFENISAGMGTSAYVAFMASLTNKKFTATQYALLTSFMAIPAKFVGATTGFMVESMGWAPFFVLCAVIALPGLLLLRPISKLHATQHS